MYPSRSPSAALSLLVLLGARTAVADCPDIWSTLASDLATSFSGCTDLAREAIRAPFHDCFPGACDGSLVLSDECTSRPENSQITGICSVYSSEVTNYDVSAADLIQLGAAVAIASCAGPDISFLIGRTDSSTADAANQLPTGNSTAATQIADFQAKGFSTADLVALVGAHTIGKNLSGSALDTTDSTWDNQFYTSTLDGSAPGTLESDENLATSDQSSSNWKGFANSQSNWETAFASAFSKMSTMGNDASSLTDCSSVVSSAVPQRRRR